MIFTALLFLLLIHDLLFYEEVMSVRLYVNA